jgi:hypothetical protein
VTADIIWFSREIRRENREHAKRNAAYSAQLLEADRAATRQEELRMLIEGYEADISKLRQVLACLREEHLLLELRRG